MEELKTKIKNFAFFATIFGIYNMLFYCIKKDIAFPLELTILPSLALAIGLISLIYVFIILIYSTISTLVTTDPLDINYSDFLYKSISSSIPKNVSALVNFFLFYVSGPLCVLLASYYEAYGMWYIFFISWLLMPFLFVLYVFTSDKDGWNNHYHEIKKETFWKSYIVFFLLGTLSYISLIFYFNFLKLGVILKEDHQYILAFIIFEILSFIVIIPPTPKTPSVYPKIRLKEESYLKKALKIPATYVYIVAITFSLMPEATSNIASFSLRLIKIGGGIQKQYYYSEKSDSPIPSEVRNGCNAGVCTTKTLNVLIDIGSMLFVEGTYFGEDRPISLPRQSLNVIESRTKALEKH